MGFLMLAGGAEFGGQMAAVDRLALERAGGLNARVRVVPAAAAPDRNDQRAGHHALRWFRGLGARDVAVVPLVDRRSADDRTVADELARAQLIYLLGGFTHYLGQTLADSASAAALRAAHAAGAVLAGSSAGAMVLCAHYFDPAEPGTPTIVRRGGQRVGTLVMYLNTPEKGGGTIFPDVQVEVAPQRGNAVFFSYERPDPSTRTLHGGAPVIAGDKWIATKWLREREFI